jgi:predicted transcriptional regulator
MIKRLTKKTVQAEQHPEVKVEETKTPVVETQSVETTPAPVVETQSAVEPKAKKVRYAPKSVLQDSAIVRLLKPKAKGESGKSKSAERFNRLHKEVQTVAEYIAAHKEAYQSGAMLARNDLRWDLEHGFISIEAPQEA